MNHIASRPNVFAKVKMLEEHIHGKPYVYPNLANSVQITCGTASAWDLGTIVEIIPANTITEDFDIHWVDISAISANDEFQLDLYTGAGGAEVWAGSCPFSRNSVQSQEGSQAHMSNLILKNTRISGAIACAGGTAKTANIKLRYHVY